MSLAMGLIGGAGQGMADVADANTKFWNERDLQAQSQQAILDRERSLAQLKVELQNAPLNRLGVQAKALIGEQIPQEAAPVTSLTGAGVTYPDGEQSSGLQGDPRKLRAQAMAMPDGEDKNAILAQLDRQMAADRDKNAKAVEGKTRTRTPEEALGEAARRAMVDDPVAFAEYESKIGKPMRDERKLDQQADRDNRRLDQAQVTEARKAEADERKWQTDSRKLDLQNLNIEQQGKKIDGLIDYWTGKNQNAADKNDILANKSQSSERMYSVVNAMSNQIKQLDDSKPKSSAPDSEKAAWAEQRSNAEKVRAAATARLNNLLNDDTPAASPSASPASSPASAPRPAASVSALPAGARQVGTSGGKPVYETPDGKRFIQQ